MILFFHRKYLLGQRNKTKKSSLDFLVEHRTYLVHAVIRIFGKELTEIDVTTDICLN